MNQYIITFITAVTSIILARVLGIQERGEVAELTLLFSWFFTIHSLMNPGTMQYNSYTLQEYLSKYLGYLKVAMVAVTASSILLGLYLSKMYLLLFIPYFFLYYANDLFQQILIRFGHMKAYWLNVIVFQISTMLFISIFILTSPRVELVLLGWICGQLVFLALNIPAINKIADSAVLKVLLECSNLRKIGFDVRQNLKNHLYHLVKGLVSSGDRLVIIFMVTTEQYAAYVVMFLFNSIIMPYCMFVQATYTQTVKDHGFSSMFDLRLAISSLIFIVGVIVLFFMSDAIILHIIGEKYVGNELLAKLIIIFSFFSVLYVVMMEFSVIKFGVYFGYKTQCLYLFSFSISLMLYAKMFDDFDVKAVPIIQIFVYALCVAYMLVTLKTKKILRKNG